MQFRLALGAAGAVLILSLAVPRIVRAQTTSPDTLSPNETVRLLDAVVVSARRSAAPSRLLLRASIDARQRENRRLARRLAEYDRVVFGLERKLDTLMVLATIQEIHIVRTDSATAVARSRRQQLEGLLCASVPAECGPGSGIGSAIKSD